MNKEVDKEFGLGYCSFLVCGDAVWKSDDIPGAGMAARYGAVRTVE